MLTARDRFRGKWWKDHSLSLIILFIFGMLMVGSYLTQHWDADNSSDRLVWINTTLHGLRDDTFGALLIVVASKWFFERGSAASN